MQFEITYFFSYYLILFYVVFSLFISLVLVLLSVLLRFLSLSRPDSELAAAYECGFLPFDRARNKFEVNFFMVGLLFVLFDLEVVFILPWGVAVSTFGGFQVCVLFVFLFVLVLCFAYELWQNALDF